MTPETIYALISEEVYLRSPQNAGLDINAVTGAVFRSSLDSGQACMSKLGTSAEKS